MCDDSDLTMHLAETENKNSTIKIGGLNEPRLYYKHAQYMHG